MGKVEQPVFVDKAAAEVATIVANKLDQRSADGFKFDQTNWYSGI